MNTISRHSAAARWSGTKGPIDTQHDPLDAELVRPLDRWIDEALEKLENEFSDFTTRQSFKGWIGRQ